MAVVARKRRLTRWASRPVAGRTVACLRKPKVLARPVEDYNGMPLEKWKVALIKDVEERFGPTPDDLVSAGEAGW